MEDFPLGITSAECNFYGDRLILLEGAIEEFLSCLHMIRRYQISRGQRDPIASFQARIKSAGSMTAKLERQGLPITADSALQDVWDAAGVRLVCPFVQNIDQTVSLIRRIPGIQILREKDYIRNPKPNGYRSYHIVFGVPVYHTDGMEYYPVELQLRTMSMDFWASMEHRICYKKEPRQPMAQEMLVEEFLGYAKQLEEIEAQMERYCEGHSR